MAAGRVGLRRGLVNGSLRGTRLLCWRLTFAGYRGVAVGFCAFMDLIEHNVGRSGALGER